MAEKILAGLVLAVCVVLLSRMLVGERRRQRMDAVLRRATAPARRTAVQAWHTARSWRTASRESRAAIERARRAAATPQRDSRHDSRPDAPRPEGEWEGNVYRPKSFRRPDKSH